MAFEFREEVLNVERAKLLEDRGQLSVSPRAGF